MMRSRLRHLPVPSMVSAVLLVVLAGVGGWLDGVPGAVGAAVGVALVAASYVASSLALAWADSVHPQMVLSVGLLTYSLKFALLGVAVFAVAASDWPGQRMLAVAIIVATVGWITAQVWWTFRARIPYVEIDPR
ncbi:MULTISPECIES: hypothetical protein [unclassified Solwaraspora]|uniref:hypothetical protein n=1 Tax=unclassified Solwaraspora TaxID=2627926 RepID=UPI00248AB2AF|nr:MULTISPECIES: hypothetical protein [unclassified Solwaraspora]WBB95798.1 hypothetical protein O7553_20850 [Solwaraspora sp. WMMA2059]WBC20298.1 hypothetical protein O7543_26530 [Solwaraspora sp. WMMA2080]WJK37551.1 hypothetical protein O7610_15055 [Solwaraspora sp. WMMA2065]